MATGTEEQCFTQISLCGTGEPMQPLQAPRAGREEGTCHPGLCASPWAGLLTNPLLELLPVQKAAKNSTELNQVNDTSRRCICT